MASTAKPAAYGYTVSNKSRLEYDLAHSFGGKTIGRTELRSGQWVRFVEFKQMNSSPDRGDVVYSPLFKVVKIFKGGEGLLLNLEGKLKEYTPNPSKRLSISKMPDAFKGDRVQVFDNAAAHNFLGEILYDKLDGIFQKESKR